MYIVYNLDVHRMDARELIKSYLLNFVFVRAVYSGITALLYPTSVTAAKPCHEMG